jgi:dihydrofolate reductase
MKLIACVDQNWGIGANGRLLMSIPEDLKHFKEITLNKTVVMGRHTFKSLPNMKPLENRRNIVLSSNRNYHISGVEVCNSIEELFEKTSNIPTDDIFIIGGESVYKQLIPYCNMAYITKIFATYPSDKYMINMDKDKSWSLAIEEPKHIYNGVSLSFSEYFRN